MLVRTGAAAANIAVRQSRDDVVVVHIPKHSEPRHLAERIRRRVRLRGRRQAAAGRPGS
jgi:hypothetical protein